MRKAFNSTLVFCLITLSVFARGSKKEVLSLSKGKYVETFDQDSIEQVGNVIYNVNSRQIVGLVVSDDSEAATALKPEVISRWLSIDPAAAKMPNISPYAYCTNNPISQFDPTGAFPYSIHIRSFAPFETFGGGFKGDNRGYSTALGKGEGGTVTSRMQQTYIVDPTARQFTQGPAWSDESAHVLGGKATAKDIQNDVAGFGGGEKPGEASAMVGTSLAAANPLVPHSPDIDVHSVLNLTENEKEGYLNVDASMSGDKFPSAEMFMGDSKGQQLMIITSGYVGNPLTSLPGDNNRVMGSGQFQVKLNDNGEFQSVIQGKNTYSIQDWNKMQTSQPVQAKPQTGN